MKKRYVLYLAIFQMCIIAFLVVHINQQNKSVLGIADPIKKTDMISYPSGGLKYFYELKANNKMTKDMSIMGSKYDYEVIYNINKDGLNQLIDYQPEKPGNVFRIVTIGASFTFGANVDTKDNYPTQLQNILDSFCLSKNKFEVLNLGVGGYDIQYSAERFLVRGKKYNPDLVIWLITDDNLSQIHDRLSKNLSDERILNIQKESLKNFNNNFRGNILFVGTSNLSWQHKNLLKRIHTLYPKSNLYLDLPEMTGENVSFPDHHPNKEGYKMIASNIFEYLKKSALISCN